MVRKAAGAHPRTVSGSAAGALRGPGAHPTAGARPAAREVRTPERGRDGPRIRARGLRLLLDRSALQRLRRHLERVWPEEGCGVLLADREGPEADGGAPPIHGEPITFRGAGPSRALEPARPGSAEDPVRRIRDVVPVPNRHERPREGYRIGPETLHALLAAEDRGGRRVAGFYHSHPAGGPTAPSGTDRRHAWAGYAYLIARMRAGRTAECGVWTFDREGAATRGIVTVAPVAQGTPVPAGEATAARAAEGTCVPAGEGAVAPGAGDAGEPGREPG